MPETAVYENDSPIFAQDQIGMSRKPWMIQPIPESTAEQEFSHQQFRLSALALYRRHTAVTLFFGQFVHIIIHIVYQ